MLTCPRLCREQDQAALGVQGAVSGGRDGPPQLAVVCWRGRATLNILVAKPECAQMLEQLSRQPPRAETVTAMAAKTLERAAVAEGLQPAVQQQM